MRIGMTISGDLKVSIGDSLDSLIQTLEDANIKYEIPYNKVAKHKNYKETIVYVRDLGFEIDLINGEVVFIKSGDNNITHIIDNEKLLGADPYEILKVIKDYINRYVNTTENNTDRHLNIERFDTTTFTTVIVFRTAGDKIRASVARNNHGDLFLNTIRKI